MASCGNGDVTYFGSLGGVAEVLNNGIDGILQKIAGAVMTAAISLFADVATNVPTLAYGSQPERPLDWVSTKPGVDQNVTSPYYDKIGLQINWLVVSIAVASLLFAAARMAIERRGQAGTTALKGILRMILVAGAGSFVVTQLALLSDHYTTHLYEAGVKTQLAEVLGSCSDEEALTYFLLIIVGLLLIVAGIIHIIMLYLRLGVMVLLLGTLPLAAAASMTEWGSSMWRKHIGWLAAWLMFKPAVGLILYVGMVMVTTGDSSSIQMKIAGCGLLLLSAIALPALLRLVMPATAALGTGDATPAAVGSAVAAGQKASGAIAAPALKYATGGRGGGGGAPMAGGKGGGSGSADGGGESGGGAGATGAATNGGGPSRTRRIISATARGAAGALGTGAAVAGRAAGAAAKHGQNIAGSSLPGAHDGRD